MRLAALLALGGLVGSWFLRQVWWFRDPLRTAPRGRGYLSPLDGRVIAIERIEGGMVRSGPYAELIGASPQTGLPAPSEGWRVVVSQSPLDVHYLYAPSAGTVELAEQEPPRQRSLRLNFWPGRHRPGPGDHRWGIRFAGASLGSTVVTVSSADHRAMDWRVVSGETVRIGQKVAVAMSPISAELYLPAAASVLVAVGDRLLGGQTLLAETATS